ncbi:MAG: SSS family transporter [Chitinophagales bacterium]|jgi:SSS family transporter
MTPLVIVVTIIAYFLFLIGIAQYTKGKADNAAFFSGNKNSKWYLVAFGMIGASLSGVTFLSVPGQVGGNAFSYMQMVVGYLLGYTFIALVLIPMYYRLNLVSIYQYLETRFGVSAHRTGSAFFLLSRIVGAAFRLFLVAGVLHYFLFSAYDIPFIFTTIITVVLIWVYTFQGGIKTIVVTDTLQTSFMIFALLFAIYYIMKDLNFSFGELWDQADAAGYTKMVFLENFATSKLHFAKQFFSGALIALVMTGLDQDMMQKNLTCKNVEEAQKNIFSMSVLLIPINFLFLCLGAFLFLYASSKGIIVPDRADYLFPEIALNHFPLAVGIIFLLGLIAAAYSSADSALTSLTTAFCVDFLGMHKEEKARDKSTRLKVHLAFSAIIILVVWLFDSLGDESVITNIFKFAGYTYGPLLGLFIFGLFTKFKVRDKFIPLVCLLSPILTYLVATYSPQLIGYTFGYELLLVNGGITFAGLLAITQFNEKAE